MRCRAKRARDKIKIFLAHHPVASLLRVTEITEEDEYKDLALTEHAEATERRDSLFMENPRETDSP
jgi:hypothetical protein